MRKEAGTCKRGEGGREIGGVGGEERGVNCRGRLEFRVPPRWGVMNFWSAVGSQYNPHSDVEERRRAGDGKEGGPEDESRYTNLYQERRY